MFGFGHLPFLTVETLYYVKNYLGVFLFSVLFSTPIVSCGVMKLKKIKRVDTVIKIIEPVFYLFLLLLCTAFIIDESFQPFLYFRF